MSSVDHIFTFGAAASWNQVVGPNSDENFGMGLSEKYQLLMQNTGQPVKKFRCEKCGKMYAWKQGLLNHVRFVCGKDPQFHCSVCTYKTHRKGNLMRHILSLHKMDPYMKQ